VVSLLRLVAGVGGARPGGPGGRGDGGTLWGGLAVSSPDAPIVSHRGHPWPV